MSWSNIAVRFFCITKSNFRKDYFQELWPYTIVISLAVNQKIMQALKKPEFDVVYDYFLQFQLRYYLLISIIFLVHIATKSDEFLSDKEKHLSQENNICSPPSSQQHCSPYYPKPPSRCGSHSESLNGSSSGKPFNIIYIFENV